MTAAQHVYIGTDGGATTSKIGGVWSTGSPVSTRLLQRTTNAAQGPAAVVRGWVEGIGEYLRDNGLTWEQVQGVGVAVPGPQQRYGVLDKSPNLPDSFTGFNVLEEPTAPRWPSALAGQCRSSSAMTGTWAASQRRSASAGGATPLC